uniref:O-methyltransferase C-terminal domain-containing protein n=1 Tax=Setaria italica TaxID=4555 RepID=K3XSK3_SETIT
MASAGVIVASVVGACRVRPLCEAVSPTAADHANITVHLAKLPCLRRLMCVLAATSVLSASSRLRRLTDELVYALTPTSRLLVGFKSLSHHHHDTPLGERQTFWEMADHDKAFNALINDGLASESRFIMDIAINECGGEVFQGITSLVDVAGGLGEAAHDIARAFPNLKCSVLDLDHVVARAPYNTDVQYIAGDMFVSVPPANAVFLKECVKILKNCKYAIPPRDAGGKVIIMDMVVGAGPPSSKHREMQAQEWRKIFLEAGFSDYKIMPVLGIRSIIELYR